MPWLVHQLALRSPTSSPTRKSLHCQPVAGRHRPLLVSTQPVQVNSAFRSVWSRTGALSVSTAVKPPSRFTQVSLRVNMPSLEGSSRRKSLCAESTLLSPPTPLGSCHRLPSRPTTTRQLCQPIVRPSADRRQRPTSVHHHRSTPIQLVVPLNRKSRLSMTSSWICRHLLVDRAAGHIGRRATTWMSVLSTNRPSPPVPPRSTPYPPNQKWNSEEPEVGFQLDPDQEEVAVFLPRNSLQLLLSVLRTRCLPPRELLK